MHVRPYAPADVDVVAQIYTDAVHQLALEHYDGAQRRAWAPERPDMAFWRERMAKVTTLLAEDEEAGEVAGFVAYAMQDRAIGYVDLLFVSPRHARRGVASRLYAAAEEAMRASGARELTTHASKVARPFFERQGYALVEVEDVEREGQVLRRFAMRKGL